jgi:hypothetical protein
VSHAEYAGSKQMERTTPKWPVLINARFVIANVANSSMNLTLESINRHHLFNKQIQCIKNIYLNLKHPKK